MSSPFRFELISVGSGSDSYADQQLQRAIRIVMDWHSEQLEDEAGDGA